MKIYASEDLTRAIMVDDENGIIKAKGLTNVLCCDPEALCETEDLKQTDCSITEWDEVAE